MENNSPVYSAIQKIIELFDLEKDVSVFSYRDSFDVLWGVSDNRVECDGKIWCVVDGGETTFNWLPIGVWGRYYRSKYGINAPKLALIGNDTALNPSPSKDTIFVPEFYTDEGFQRVTLESKDKDDFIVRFYKAIQVLITMRDMIAESGDIEKAEKDLSADEQKVKAWQGMVYATLSSPSHRHAVSNEIAPMVLREALLSLKVKGGGRNNFIEKLENALDLKEEQKALLKLWEWASEFISLPASLEETQKYREENVTLGTRRMKDVWNVWSNARYLLIDDQAKSHGYEHILRCALEFMIGKVVDLEANVSITSPDAILKNFGCLFLDLRLAENDLKNRNYKDLTGIRLAKDISEIDQSFPIIIFSSSQQREIDNLFSEYKNIITCFRKPGIAGAVDAVDGNRALNNLFSAIKRAFEMIENRLVYKKTQELQEITLQYKDYDEEQKELYINFSKNEGRELFNHVFMDQRYDKAFDFPYSFFEEQFEERISDLKFINLIGVKSKDKNKIYIEAGPIYNKMAARRNNWVVPWKRGTKIFYRSKDVSLKDLEIEQWSDNNLNLNLRALHQFRNLASHRLPKFTDMRREAIVVLLLFLDILLGNKGTYKIYDKFGNRTLNYDKRNIQLYLIHKNPDSETREDVKGLLAEICYYGMNSIYNKIYTLLENE